MFKLFRFLKQYKLSVAAVFILVFFQAISELYLPTLMADIVDKGIVNGDTAYIMTIGGRMLVVAVLGTACAALSSFLSSRTSTGFGKILRNKVFTQVENFSLQEFEKFGTASLITRTTNDITQMQQVVMLILRMMLRAPMMCIGGVIMAVSKDATLSLVIVFAIPLLAALIMFVTKKGMPLFKAMQVKLDRLNLVLREGLMGIRVIRAFDRVDYEKKRFNEANRDLTDTAVRVNKIMAVLMPVITLMLNFTIIAIIWFGGIRIDNGYMQVGDLMAFIQYVMQIMFALIMVSMLFVMIPRASVSAARINEVLDTDCSIKDVLEISPCPNLRVPSGHPMHPDSPKGFINFNNVTFSYPGAEKPALSDVSFCVRPGEVTAIIGSIGSGKSTLLSLMLRLFDVNSGSILIDSVDIREMPQDVLRAKIGYVPQKSILFTGTIAENIRYGNEGATDEEVEHAAEIAQAAEFISQMADGLESVIDQGGTNVSGGQKQRLSIARALVRRPEIYAFDDSFSALDFKTDAKLRKALREETADAAVIVVAQRVSTVMDADQIIVLDEGKVAGTGKHKELLNTCGVYREIVSSQLSLEELA